MEDGICYFCEKYVTGDDYCFGCKKYICQDCATNFDLRFGGHDVDEHQEEPETEDEEDEDELA